MQKNEYLIAKIGVDTAENEPRKVCCVVSRSRKASVRQTLARETSGKEWIPKFCRPRYITLSEARSRLYQHRFLQPNTHFSAFFEIYKIIWLNFQNSPEIRKFFENLQNFSEIFTIFAKSREMLSVF